MQRRNLKRLLAASTFAVALPLAVAAQDVEAEIVPLADWNTDDLYTDGVSVEEILGADINGPTGEDIGDVENVLFSEDGKVLSIIAEVGGFFELGDTHVNIPWEMVEAAEWDDGIEIPFTQEAIEDYTLFQDELVTSADAAEVQEVEGDNLGVVDTGPRVWRAGELIGDYARLRDGEGLADYGYVDDIILRDGEIAAVIVNPDASWGEGGYYAYPHYGYRHGWNPGLAYYDLPYGRDEVEAAEPFDREMLES